MCLQFATPTAEQGSKLRRQEESRPVFLKIGRTGASRRQPARPITLCSRVLSLHD